MPSKEPWKHPEQLDDEVYLGNVGRNGRHYIRWRTRRFGKVAYGKDGEVVDSDTHPLFVKRKEYLLKGRED